MFLFSVCILVLLCSDVIGNPDVIWAIRGRKLSLNCDSDVDCAWNDPQRFQLQRTTLAEATSQKRRFVDDKSCKIEIDSVDEPDTGVWECVSDGGSKTTFEVSLALEPASVHIETIQETSEVRCVVHKAKPRPKIIWYVDDVIIEETKTKFFEGKC